MRIAVRYPDWLAHNETSPIRVHDQWRVCFLLEPLRVQDRRRPGPNPSAEDFVERSSHTNAVYRVHAKTLSCRETPTGDWSVASAASLRFLFPGRHDGTFAATGELFHDTHRVDDSHLRALATQMVTVASISYVGLPGARPRRRRPTSRRASAPVALTSTEDGPRSIPGYYLLEVALSA